MWIFLGRRLNLLPGSVLLTIVNKYDLIRDRCLTQDAVHRISRCLYHFFLIISRYDDR